jgi:microcystin-dependent protein
VQYLGETFLFPVVDGRSLASTSTDFQYFYPCDGATLPVNGGPSNGSCSGPTPPVDGPSNLQLATVLGADTTGSDATFALPDMAPPTPQVQWFVSNTGPMPTGQPADDVITLVGQISIYPTPSGGQSYSPGELLPCDGRTLPTEGYPELFSLLGTAFGGDGQQTFLIPELPAPGPSLMYGMTSFGTVPQLVPMKAEAPA